MRILVLDVGTSSVKAGVYDTRLGRALRAHRAPITTVFDGPRVEISATALLRAVRRAGSLALAGGKGGAEAVCFCAFSSGVVVTDAAGTPRTPVIPHSDRRSTQVAESLVKSAGKAWWLRRAGNLPYPGGIGASTLAWLKHHEPQHFRGDYRTGQVSSLVGHMLTGQWVSDPSQAAFLGVWDIRTHRWNDDLCRLVGIRPAALPRVEWADSVIGTLSRRCANTWGLPAGIPVVGGCIDTSAGIIQSPMLPGQLTHNAGSTDVLAMTLPAPAPAEGILCRPVGVGRVYPPAWLAVRTIASAGSALEWARQTMFSELAPRAWQRELGLAAKDVSAVTCLPAFAGQRAAIVQSAGATFAGMTLGTTRRHMLAALMSGLVVESVRNYTLLAAIHRPLHQVRAMGGSSDLGAAMHRAWPGRHRFVPLPDNALRGLGQLCQRVLDGG